MSTKAIRKALERLAELEDGSGPETLRALVEVQKIERLARSILSDSGARMGQEEWVQLERIAQDAPWD